MSEDALPHVIVAGVDGSASSLHAVRWAAREALRQAVPLLLLHSVYVPSPEPYVPVRLPRSYGEALREQGTELLTEAAKVAQEAASGVVVRTEQRNGPASGHLLRLAESAELLVVGSRGLGAVAGVLLGSVAGEVAAHAHCPVVVVRGRTPESAPRETGPVVVGVDGSVRGAAAVRFAFDMAAARAAPLVVVHVAFRSTAVMPEEAGRQVRAGSARYPGLEVRERIVHDRPVRGLLDVAEDASLVVVGSRGRGGFTGLPLGSTSQAVLRHASCPVAIVREKADQ
ncbi:MAG TPA: universal stress protein [Amycolatopsis sp.]|nr:universal stress protein [Amycolatopsis sp.]